IVDEALAGGVIVGLAVPIVIGYFVEEILVAEDRQGSPQGLLERHVGSRAPGDRRLAGLDPSEIQLADALADDHDRRRSLGLAVEHDHAKLGEIDRTQRLASGRDENMLDAPSRLAAGISSRRLLARRHPTPDQLMVSCKRLVEGSWYVRRDLNRSARE